MSLESEGVRLKEIKLNKSYEDYVGPAILWALEDHKTLAKALDVVRVVPIGSFISGLFGGERKSGNEHYAGLVISNTRLADGGLYIRLFNMEKEYLVPLDLMKRYGIDVYKVHYFMNINPFKCSASDVILSSTGEDELKNFIMELIRINKEVMTEADERRLRKLSEELRAARIRVLDGSLPYVIYRGKSVFTACVPEGLSKFVNTAETAYMKCKSVEQAYYYAAVLNYMAYKVISRKRAFVRDQYTKPLLAIATAGLSWKDLPPELRDEIANLSSTLSRKLTWVGYRNQKEAILEIAKSAEFVKITELLDKHIESAGKQDRLDGALEFVSGSGVKLGRRIESRHKAKRGKAKQVL